MRVVVRPERAFLIDDCDADLIVGAYHLSKSGVALYVRLEGKRYLHRLIGERISGGPLGKSVVDHMNGDTLDNRRVNLRVVSHAENTRNRTKLNKNNTSGHMGVRFKADRSKWQAYIMTPAPDRRSRQKMKHIGYFATCEEAVKARLDAETDLWGVQPFHVAV